MLYILTEFYSIFSTQEYKKQVLIGIKLRQ